ncbi:MAG: phosphate acyltransferase PlsX [Dehalococcoidia bacterium]
MTNDGSIPAGMMPVALDAMGGDFGPSETVPAAIKAASTGSVAIALVGDPAQLQAELDKHDGAARLPIQVVPSEGVVTEDEHPALAFRSKPKASVFVAAGVVKAGKAKAFVSMGSTGASIAAATVVFGTMDGVERGALGGPIVGFSPNMVIIDLGTNMDSRPQQLLDFAALGGLMSRLVYRSDNPRVALLSVGAEEGKGNRLVRETTELLKTSSLNFIGNVEANDLPFGKAEVVICDGFVGNVILKLTEALGDAVVSEIKSALGDSPEGQGLARTIFEKMNTLKAFGGGPILGVNGVAVVGHGRARASSIASAISTAKHVVEIGFVEASAKELAKVRAEVEI